MGAVAISLFDRRQIASARKKPGPRKDTLGMSSRASASEHGDLELQERDCFTL